MHSSVRFCACFCKTCRIFRYEKRKTTRVFLLCKCLLFRLELVNESDGDITQGVHDVFGGGGQAAGKGTHEFVVVDGMVAQHGEGEQVELGFQGNMAVQLICQDR